MVFAVEFLDAVITGDLDQIDQMLQSQPELASARLDDGTSIIIAAANFGQTGVAARLSRERNDLSLFEAATVGCIQRCGEILHAIPDAVKAVSSDGCTALSYAAKFGQIEVVDLLLRAGADPNFRSVNEEGLGPLHAALSTAKTAVSLVLLNRGADPNLVSGKGWTPLHFAADIGDAEIASYLLELGADYSIKSEDGQTAAELAVDVGHDPVADVIFETCAAE